MFQTAHRFVEHIPPAAARVTDDFTAFDADERGGVGQLPQAAGDPFGDELAVGEKLKVAVRVRGEEAEQLRVHERFAAEDAKEDVAVPFGVGDRAVERVEVDRVFLLYVHPATLTAEVAGVEDGEVKERREILSAPDPALEPPD